MGKACAYSSQKYIAAVSVISVNPALARLLKHLQTAEVCKKAALLDYMTLAWKQWKYPLVLSLMFLLLYGFIAMVNPTPSVDLPDDIRTLLNDRRRLGRPPVGSTDAPVILEHHLPVVVAAEFWYPAENLNGRKQRFDSENLELNRIRNSSRYRNTDRNRNEEAASNLNDNGIEAERRISERWLHDREIVGNERFVNRFQSGIQKPEDFYERNKEMAVKIRNDKSRSTSQQTDRNYLQTTQQPTGSKNSTNNLLFLSTRTTVLAKEQQQTSQRSSGTTNATLPTNITLFNLTTDFGSHRGPHIHGVPAGPESFRAVDSKEKSTVNQQPPVSVNRSQSEKVGFRDSFQRGSRSQASRKTKVNGTTLADLKSAPYPPKIVQGTGAFVDRVRAYNKAIAAVSAEILELRGFGPWRDVAKPERLNVIWGNTDDFLERLSEHAGVITVLLPWLDDESDQTKWSSLTDTSNVLVKEYYEWSATAPMCAWIQTPGFTRGHWDAVYDRECNEELRQASRPKSLEYMYFHARPININHYWPNYGTSYPAYFYTRPPPYDLYVHLLQDAVVNTVGDVVTGDLKLVPYTCSHDYLPTVPMEYPERPVYRQLFVMTQFWGTSFFHKMVEVMPRVAPYVDFLRANPSVQIHAPEDRSQVSELLRMLGIDPIRVVTGVTRAKLVYLPQGTPCGFADARSIQLLSNLLRNYVQSTGTPSHQPRRDRLIYVRRSGTRRFAVDSQIEFVLRAVAESHGLNYTVFSDQPSPPLSTAAELFGAAVAVVGPHGAGLSNVVFSEPGTAVIEGVCNEPHVNMCYQMTAHMLGLRYHAIPSRGGCERVVDIAASDVETAVEAYVDMVLADIRRHQTH